MMLCRWYTSGIQDKSNNHVYIQECQGSKDQDEMKDGSESLAGATLNGENCPFPKIEMPLWHVSLFNCSVYEQ